MNLDLHITIKISAEWEDTIARRVMDLVLDRSPDEIDLEEMAAWLKSLPSNAEVFGGFAFDLDGRAWNGYWDEEAGRNSYYLGDLSTAAPNLRAVMGLLGQVGLAEVDFIQSEYSEMVIAFDPVASLVGLRDPGYGLKEVQVSAGAFFRELSAATTHLRLFILELMGRIGSDRNPVIHRIEQTLEQLLVLEAELKRKGH